MIEIIYFELYPHPEAFSYINRRSGREDDDDDDVDDEDDDFDADVDDEDDGDDVDDVDVDDVDDVVSLCKFKSVLIYTWIANPAVLPLQILGNTKNKNKILTFS